MKNQQLYIKAFLPHRGYIVIIHFSTEWFILTPMLKNWFKVMLLFVGNELVLRLTKPNEYGVKIFTVITCFYFLQM